MSHAISVGIVLAVLWLLLSGHYGPLLLTFGVLSCVLVAHLTLRMEVADEKSHAVRLTSRAVVYWAWLIVEIVKANLSVARIILHPKLPISPTMVRVRATQRSDVALATYANSITLTPGTVTTGLTGDELVVHALTHAGAQDLVSSDMDSRVTRMEGGS